jgi:hypothetical protein
MVRIVAAEPRAVRAALRTGWRKASARRNTW